MINGFENLIFCHFVVKLHSNLQLIGVGVDFIFPKEEEGTLTSNRSNTLTHLKFIECLVGVWKVFGNCLEGVWWLSGGCLKGV